MKEDFSIFLMKSCALFLLPVFFFLFAASEKNSLSAEDSFSVEIVNAHNKYRNDLGLPGLTWSPELAAHARKWSDHLASMGGRKIMHAPASERGSEGENIWWGSAGYYSLTQMVDGWGAEKKYFVYGTFPGVSSTGNWADVGHYTQIIWKTTTFVGCGRSTAGGYDIFVCRYSPPGNFMGMKPY